MRRLTSQFSVRVIGSLLLITTFSFAQTPKEQAWTILQEASTNSKSQTRAAAARALGLITHDAKSVSLLEKALQDKDSDVRAAAATSLGMIKNKSSIPQLIKSLKDKDGDVVMATAKALTNMQDEKGYGIYYAVVTGTLKSGQGLVGSEENEMSEIMKNPTTMATEAFQQGMGFVPYGGVAMGAYEAIRSSGKKEALVKAAAVRALATDPDPRSGEALITAATDKEWVVRAAAFDTLSRRGPSSVIPDIVNGLSDNEEVVKLTAAAAIAQLASLSK